MESLFIHRFTYRSKYKINTVVYKNNNPIVFHDNKITIWGNNKIIQEIEIKNRIIDAFSHKNGIICSDRKKLYFFIDTLLLDLCPISPFGCILSCSDHFIYSDDFSINKICLFETRNKYEHIINDIYKYPNSQGLCTSITMKDNTFYLGYENGKVYSMNNKCVLLYDFKEPVIKVFIINDQIYAALFEGRIVNITNKRFTKIPFQIKCTTIFNEYIMVGSDDGLIIVLDSNLNFIFQIDYKCELVDIISLDGILSIIMKDGLIMEYVLRCEIEQ
ncbi:hypothetical protein TCON_1249 [Astathelohania contejeani]|uniref:Uncharacterized protein n=1 Tax=Astathelohania contejeani TaxID=164912 RepID=A0ABQ7HZJ5_9MICR|nr:hypothetical protein TCON_1249 [Thelohania contejeani]